MERVAAIRLTSLCVILLFVVGCAQAPCPEGYLRDNDGNCVDVGDDDDDDVSDDDTGGDDDAGDDDAGDDDCPPDDRFEDHGGYYLDTYTDLWWSKAGLTYDYNGAIDKCLDHDDGGLNWRLPTLDEYETIFEAICDQCGTCIPEFGCSERWSIDTCGGNEAYTVSSYHDPCEVSCIEMTETHWVICVSG